MSNTVTDKVLLITRQEVAQRINVGLRTIDKMVKHNAIPFIKVGRLVRFCPDRLDNWVQDKYNNKPATN